MQREFTYRDVTFTVHANAAGPRKWRWRYVLPWSVEGECTAAVGSIEAAFRNGERAAHEAIDLELDG